MAKKTDIVRCLIALSVLMIVLVPACRDKAQDKEPVVSVQVLFANQCTPCHGWEEATQIHGSEETILQLIQRMRKKGARLTDTQAMNIAGFLGAPSRHVFEARCTKCHDMDTLLSAHGKGRMTLGTIEKMRKKKGADISEEDVKTIQEYVNRYYITETD